MDTNRVYRCSKLCGYDVTNPQGESLGKIEDFVLDLDTGTVAYAVLSFGGFLGIGDKYFAIPWQAFSYDTDKGECILNVEKERLQNAPGFDKDNWPDMASWEWGRSIYEYYNIEPYWTSRTAGSRY